MALPRTWPAPATRLAVAPAFRPTNVAVRTTDAPVPVPAVEMMVEFPALNRMLPKVWVEAALLLPR